MYGMDFMRRSHELLAVEGLDTPDMQFNPCGYLTLASEEGYEQLRENYEVQKYVYVMFFYSVFRHKTYISREANEINTFFHQHLTF